MMRPAVAAVLFGCLLVFLAAMSTPRVVGDGSDVLNPKVAQNYVKSGEIWAGFYHYYISTGDELVSIGTVPGEGQIFDSNRYTIHGMLTRLGCEVISEPGLKPDALAKRAGEIDPQVMIVRSTKVPRDVLAAALQSAVAGAATTGASTTAPGISAASSPRPGSTAGSHGSSSRVAWRPTSPSSRRSSSSSRPS